MSKREIVPQKRPVEEEQIDEELTSRINTLANGSIVSLISLSYGRIISLCFTFLVTTFAGANVYGVVFTLEKLSSKLSNSFSGVYVTAERTIPRYKEEIQNTLITVSYGIILLFTVFAAIGLYINRNFLAANTELLANSNSSLVIYTSFLIINLGIITLTGSLFKTFKQTGIGTAITLIILPTINLISITTILYLFSPSSEVLLQTLVVSSYLTIGICLILLFRYTNYSPFNYTLNPEPLYDYLNYLGPTLASMFIINIQMLIFPLFAALFLNPIQAGAFTLSFLLANLVRLPLSSLNQIFGPVATELYATGDSKVISQLYTKTTYYLLTITLPLFLFFAIFSKNILLFFAPQYTNQTLLLPLLSVGTFIASIFGSVGLLLLMTDNERVVTILHIGITIVSVILAYFLTLSYGAIGLAASSSLIALINNASETALLNKYENLMPFNRTHLKIAVLGGFLFIWQIYIPQNSSIFLRFMIYLVTIILYLKIVYSYIFSEEDRKLIKQSLKTN